MLLPDILTRRELTPLEELPLATEGVLRYVWESRFGAMLVEVRDGLAYVNGRLVEPAEPSTAQPLP